MLEILWAIGAFAVTLGILVTFHEFGHFWVARRCGVKVLVFSVGFGKAIWQRTAADGTVYQVGIIPLGGYVRMLDERVDEVPESERHLSFNSQSVRRRAAIIAAGPAANFVIAVVLLWVMFVIGVPSVKPVIGSIQPDSVAAQADIQTPAEILSVNGNETEDWQQVNLAFAAALGNEEATIRVLDARDREQSYVLDIDGWRIGDQQQPTFVELGMLPWRPEATTTINYIAENSPAAAADFAPGDKIIAVDGTPVEEWSQIREQIMAAPGERLSFTVERGQTQIELTAAIGERSTAQGTIGFLGVEPQQTAYPDEYRFVQQYGIVGGLIKGAERTWDLMVLSVQMIGKLVTGTVSLSNLSGPVAIAEGAGASASYGLVYFLGFLALISVNLGIINLVPLPILDGGHLVFLAIEGARKKAVSERVQELSYRIGGLLIFALMAIAISNDVLRLAQ
ncbi:zinc metallopeptidase RseP [Pseudidiomarina salinarum]|uniref:Zinc metalloprotease n=1 Tax=Pseudidiomarina salinarum TaxID=435908 RepID=A0A094JGM8_9GAMM|nr:sigma E protease regulator RseP [Pseudidiomarina salinarum]KFZ31711.1 zinc metallopeptidase RseP [Pseudidiomarina salinarum]RUO70518.1 sigma E protease regulator RseP [Pseudidiomarina salinarum]